MTEIKSDDLSMNLSHLLNARRAAGKPVRVALIGLTIEEWVASDDKCLN